MPDYAVWGKAKGTVYKFGSHLVTIQAMSAESALKEARRQSKVRRAVLYGCTVTRVRLVKGK